MKTIILCVLTLFVGLVAKAQSTTANLNIILTDVQSVRFDETSQNDLVATPQEAAQNTSLQMLSQTGSQVKKIQSKTSEYDKLYKMFYSASKRSEHTTAALLPADKRSPGAAARSVSHIIYQVDPR